MNKIVREHYPVSRLPSDLREGLAPDARVTIIVSEEAEPQSTTFYRDLFESLRHLRRTEGDPVAEIRAMRDDWEERLPQVRSKAE